MIKYIITSYIALVCLVKTPAFSQTEKDSTVLGLAGDNLDLYAVLDLFQQSKTIEDFEKSLNEEKSGINNLDLNLDQQVDFIKVETKKNEEDYTFILQVAVSKTEIQDVAVILLSKDKDKKITLQIVGDIDLYGKDYIVELKESKTPPVTANPGYIGTDTVISKPATTKIIIVESAPIVQYVYSPVYIPYYSPYYYGFYPPYYTPFPPVSVGFYIGFHSSYHMYGGYRGGNTVVIHNQNNYINYNNNSRKTSNTVNRNNGNGNYNKGNNSANRPTNNGGSNRPASGSGNVSRPSNSGGSASNRPSTGSNSASRPSAGSNNSGRPVKNTAPSNRQPNSYPSQQNKSNSNGANRNSGKIAPSGGGSRGGGSYNGGGRGGRR